MTTTSLSKRQLEREGLEWKTIEKEVVDMIDENRSSLGLTDHQWLN